MANTNNTEAIRNRILDEYGTKTLPKRRTGGSDLSKDAFLNLLTTQLRYQNPLEPTNDKEFLAQMAQFTALEQMNNLYASFQFSQAGQMINKNVEAQIKNEKNGELTKIEGKVIAVNVKENKPYLLIQTFNGGQKEVELSKVKTINDGTTLDAEVLSKQIEKLQIGQINALINKMVVAEIAEKEGEEPVKIEGKVVGFNFAEEKQKVVIQLKDGTEKQVDLSKIKLINDGTTLDAEFLAGKIAELTNKITALENAIKELKP